MNILHISLSIDIKQNKTIDKQRRSRDVLSLPIHIKLSIFSDNKAFYFSY